MHPIRTQPLVLVLPVLVASVALSRVAGAYGPRDVPLVDKPAVPVEAPETLEERFSLHFQLTAATQWHPAFDAKYSGKNSLSPDAESATALVSTLFADAGLWPGGELIFDPELSGGSGLSATKGVAAFPSGIVYRVGDPAPVIYVARLALRQTIGLGGRHVHHDPGANELAGTQDQNTLRISVGRLSVTDVFDANTYAHDPTERFFNWALFASGAWDYPADTRGYTYGALADLAYEWWSVRAGIALEPKYANLAQMDFRLGKSHGLMAEYEARYEIAGQRGATSALFFFNQARMGSYDQVTSNPAAYGNDVAATRADGRTKFGFAISAEQALRHGTGVFLRVSANDGQNESWAFTEIDRSLAFGIVQAGDIWKRPEDEVGVAFVVNGLSSAHERYLGGGGLGFILGDGALNYGPEMIADVYYKAYLAENVALSAIYQPIVNPGYNQDRGPVHVFSGRLHVAF